MIYKSLLITSLIISSSFSLGLDGLNLKDVVKTSLSNDPWLSGNEYSQRAIEAKSISARTLPDPKISITAANLPLDTLNFNQEAMTQLKIGISQVFPRGDTLEIKGDQLKIRASQFPYQREERKSKVTLKVAKLWLDAYKAQESISLIQKDRSLFEQLVDISESSYSSNIGKTRVQDIIRAQLQLTKLDDRLTKLKQKKEMFLLTLSEWLYDVSDENQISNNLSGPFDLVLPKTLPDLELISKDVLHTNDQKTLFSYFNQHPSIKVIEQKIKETSMGISLAKQKYKPQFGFNASYGYRDDDPKGKNRADLFSAGVSFDLPIFTKNKQDKEVQVAMLRTQSIKTQKIIMLRSMLASFEAKKSNLERLEQRKTLYKDTLLPQISEQAEAALTAYTNDDGNFAEVVRARIAQLNAKIDALGISVDIQKNIVQLNYLFITKAEGIINEN